MIILTKRFNGKSGSKFKLFAYTCSNLELFNSVKKKKKSNEKKMNRKLSVTITMIKILISKVNYTGRTVLRHYDFDSENLASLFGQKFIFRAKKSYFQKY